MGRHASGGWLLLVAGLLGCATSRTLRIESNRPATITPRNGQPLCTGTECSWTFSRETCFLFNSSSGFLGLTARSDDGMELHTPMMETCQVKPGTVVRFVFPSESEACQVVLLEGGQVTSRWPCASGKTP